MPDDQTLHPKNGIVGSSDRSDDAPSSAQLGAGGTREIDLAGRLSQVQTRAIHGLRSLRAAVAPQIPSAEQVRHLLAQRNPAQVATAAAVMCCLGLGATAVAAGDPAGIRGGTRPAAEQATSRPAEPVPVDAAAPADAAAAAEAPVPDKPAPAAPAKPAPAAPAKPAPPKKQLPPGHLESGPVAGLSDVQMNNAKAIVWTGVDMRMPRRALVIAVATAMQESELLNRASEVLPESKRYPHQGTGWDHDSVGLFQQRTSTGWGRVNQLMDPAYASQQFYHALMRVPGWQNMALTDAAQSVQVSAFGWLYAQHEGRAQQVVNALTNVR